MKCIFVATKNAYFISYAIIADTRFQIDLPDYQPIWLNSVRFLYRPFTLHPTGPKASHK